MLHFAVWDGKLEEQKQTDKQCFVAVAYNAAERK